LYGDDVSTHNKTSESQMPLTLFDKIWRRHVAGAFSDGRALIAIDRHVVQETTSWHAFDALRDRGLTVRHPELRWSVIDYRIATPPGHTPDSYPPARDMILGMRRHRAEFGLCLLRHSRSTTTHRARRFAGAWDRAARLWGRPDAG
jgi:homoaconitase/3-isopropylmalate dehydratase large subunit